MKNHLTLGVIFTLLSALCYASQTSVIKFFSTHISIPLLVFIQSLVCLILVLPVLGYKYRQAPFKVAQFSNIKKQHFIRTIFSLGINYLLFIALKHLAYFDSILLYNTFPLFIPIIALIVLRTRIDHRLWLFILIGFFGVGLTMHLDSKIFSLPALLAIGSGISAAVSIVMMRKISSTDNSIKSLFYYFLFSTIISGLIALPEINLFLTINWLPMILVGVLFFFVQYFLTLGTTFTTPSVVSNLYYSNIVFSLILSHFVFRESITKMMLLGMICIVFGGMGIVFWQKRVRVKK